LSVKNDRQGNEDADQRHQFERQRRANPARRVTPAASP
jgi:hypothetical protein